MFWFFPPSHKPTTSEYAVLFVFASIGFIALGIAALVMGFRAPPEKHALAVQLEWRGVWCLALGAVIGFCVWLYNRLVD